MKTPKPANILFVHNNNDLYGAEVALLAMLKRLDRTRFAPLVVLPSDTRHINRLSVELDKIGVEYKFMQLGILRRRYLTGLKVFGHMFRLLIGILSLARLIRQRKIDIVHSNTLAVVDGACAAFVTRRPHIWHVHELLVDPPWLRRAMHYIAPRLSTRVIANSEAVRRHILADAPSYADRVQVILNGIDLNPFGQASGASRVRREWGVGADEMLVGMIGKVTRWKGQLILARAAQKVLESRSNVKFAAVGGVFDDERYFMDRFRSEVEQLGIGSRFIISDFRRDVPDILGAFDIFVLPSTWPEPFGLVVVEAMAAGKPVIATAQGGPLEIVVPGETGYLIPAGDECALAESIGRLLDAPELIARFGAAGRRRASELFSVSRYVLEFENLYLALLPSDGQVTAAAGKVELSSAGHHDLPGRPALWKTGNDKGSSTHQRLRVGIDIHLIDGIYQGSRTHCIEVFSRAVQLAQDIDFFFFLSDPAKLFKANASFAAANATVVPISHGGAPARLLFELPALARRWNLDLLHCQYIVPPICSCATAVTIHDILFESNPEFFSNTFVLRSRLMVRRSARQSSLVFTGSEFSRQELIGRYKLRNEQVTCIYNGVDHSRFRVVEQPANELEPYGLTKGGYLLTVGRLEPRKNHLRLLQAYGRLPQPRPKLVIIGERDFGYTEILETIRRDHLSGEVVFLEHVDDTMLPVFYRNASLFVYPSLAEGFGLPLLEAMASGIAVVTSANTSLREVGGDAVLYIRPEDPESIASGISAVLADAGLRKSLVDRGLRRVTEYSWEDSADRMVSEYRGLRRRNRKAIAGGGPKSPVSEIA